MLSPTQKKYIYVEQGISSAFFNLLINGGIAWLLFKGETIIPVFGDNPSVLFDGVVTLFLLGVLLTGIVTPLARRAAIKKPELRPTVPRAETAVLKCLPKGLLLRCLFLGAVITAVLVPLFLLIFSALGVESLSPIGYVVFKGIYTGIVGGALAIVVVWSALCDVAEEQGTA